MEVKEVFKTGTSQVVTECQISGSKNLIPILFLGYLPPVNKMNKVGSKPKEETAYPAEVLYCPDSHLVQLGLTVDANILFPPEYPYTSSTTKILRDNFAEMYQEATSLFKVEKNDLVIDIGSNDGNLLSNWKDNHRVLGITPEEIGKIAIERGIPTIIDYFRPEVVDKVIKEHGKAKVVTATNVFAHIENVNKIVEDILRVLHEDGVFISESHYLLPLIETLQYDTVYHEHLRYYSLASIKYLLDKHGLEIWHIKEIPTHGGSIRVYASRKGKYKVDNTVDAQLKKEAPLCIGTDSLYKFRDQVMLSKLKLMSLLVDIKTKKQKIYGISAPSRASTLINYVGIDNSIMDYVLEIKGSHKIGKYMPGTLIPIEEEGILFEHQPEYAMLLSWHIADELIPKLKAKGYKGKFIVPLPEPHIVS
ncbi:MAG: class I SAM-dependent methyltransferase [Cytophagales bacterium]|nr:class I SAM-dependent methyltransferase [Cytophagales bacterium]